MKRYPTKAPSLRRHIRPEAAPALRRLIAELSAREDELPCQLDPNSHYDDNRTSDAITACGRCPLIEPCAEFAAANRERHGVWGGRDRNPKHETTAGSPRARSERPTLSPDPDDPHNPAGSTAHHPRGEGASEPQSDLASETDRTSARTRGGVVQVVSVEVTR